MKKSVICLVCFALAFSLLLSIAGCTNAGDSKSDPSNASASADNRPEPSSDADPASDAAGTSSAGDTGDVSASASHESSHPKEESGSGESSDPPEALTLPDLSSMPVSEFFREDNPYFNVGADAFRVIDSYVRGNSDRIKTRYALDENVVLPEEFPQNTIADYRDYCITQISNEPYALNGTEAEKVTVAASLSCIKEGQKGFLDFRLDFVHAPRERNWKLIRLDVQNGSKPKGDGSIPLTDPMTLQDFLSSSKCQELQLTAFNLINAYFSGDYEEVRQMFIAPGWTLDPPDAWDSRSRDDYAGYGISGVAFEPYDLDGEQVQKAHFYLSMYCAIPGEEGVYDPCIELVYTDNRWKVLQLDFSA